MRHLTWIAILLVALGAAADDGEMLRRNIPKTPELDSEHASIKMMPFYVPAQSSDGILLEEIEYTDFEGTLIETRDHARPLVATYLDGHVEGIEGIGFKGHGHRDAFAAVSLDDGETWSRRNLSKSGDLSSFDIRVKKKWVPYPGDVVTSFTALEENKVLVTWASRYCRGGSPSYGIDDTQRDALAAYLEIDGDCNDGDPATPCLYLEDYWGVSGSQGSSDFADEGYPEVGEVPFSCLWAARGTLELDDDTGLYGVVWRMAERLTSGRRDVNRVETACEPGAGCVVTWQEDPEGLRPGEGEGPGEGWSGAIAHHKTDIWYSYIDWDLFDLVDEDGIYGEPIELAEYTADTLPPVGVPMSMPVRLTDNAMCVTEDEDGNLDDPYCYADFDDTGKADFCADVQYVDIVTPEGPTAHVPLCVAEDGRLMRGNIASTRARVNLRGYDSDDDGLDDSAWVILAYEESKGLGEEEVDSGLVNPNDTTEYTKVDMGKNIWYHTFGLFNPELVSQGLMLNQPAVYPDDFSVPSEGSLVADTLTEDNFMLIDPDPIYEEQADLESTLYQTEIARRFSLISQTAAEAGESGTVAFATWKQGIIRRGGPADVMARRFVLPDGFDATVDNPFAYANMVCDTWAFNKDETANPRYVKGLCLDPAIALSTTDIVACDDGTLGTDCAALFPWDEYFSDIDMTVLEGDSLAKVDEWVQTGPDYGVEPDPEANNLDDNSWDNPYDVAKGHRGFINGDFIMLLFAWSPNWHDNTVGHDNYNLYVRRSFDGGQTWTTTPATFTHTDEESYSGAGNTTCEWMDLDTACEFSGGECPVCTDYAAGAFEQARNVSQLVGSQETILDPRYTPTTPSITPDSIPDGFFAPEYADDTRDPSRFFIVYETGDNTTVELGEAEPLDLFYSRAINWGDDYELADADGDGIADVVPEADYWETFDWLEGSGLAMSGEAGVTASPGGQFFYAIWNQEDLDKKGNVIGSDAFFRRVMELDSDLGGGVDGVTTPSGGAASDPEDPPEDPPEKPGKKPKP